MLVGERGRLRPDEGRRGASRSRRRCRRSWPPASTGCRPRRSGCSRRPSVIGKDVPFVAAPGDRRSDRRSAPRRPRPPPGGRVPVRDEPVPGPRVHLQACADPRGGLREPAPGPPARAPRPDRRGHRGACYPDRLAEQSSGSPTTRLGARRGTRPSRYLRQAGARAAARSAHREAAVDCSSRRWLRSGTCRRRARPCEQAIDLRLDLCERALRRSASTTRMLGTWRPRQLAATLGDQRRLGRAAADLPGTLRVTGDAPRSRSSWPAGAGDCERDRRSAPGGRGEPAAWPAHALLGDYRRR